MPPEIEADFIIQPPEGFDCSFEIYASGTVWGAIEGDIENQSDLKNALDSKADDTEITEIDGRLDTIESTLSGYGNIVTHDTNEFATAEQGQKADNAVPNTRTVNGKALSSNITLNYSDVGALSSSTTINDLTTTAQQNALNSGATTTNIGQIATNTNAISLINGKIPTQASTTNQLADKNFVNSSIATNTANFIGTFNSVADLEAYSGTLTNNDYAFVISTDADGNTVYNRYKWNGSEWLFEYALNNSSFTASQWASINSGVTSTDVTLLGTINTTMSGYGNIVTHNVSEFATASQGALANTSLQNGTDVINALGYTPYNSTNPNNYSSTLNGLTDVSLTNPTQGQNLTYDAVNQKWINSSTTATVGWGGITGTLSDQSDLQNALNDKQNVIDGNNKLSASYISGLGAVATSNNYNDLSNKPTIPSAQVNSDWNANSGVAQILNKPTLSTVATSGSYNDLTNKPTIPTVNNATLTIQKNGTNVQTFTANASTNATANIIVPTDVSDLTNTTLANVSLSNLDTTGNNRLHALKGYTENGQVYSDSTLYNDVYAQYHSTFDASKFTVVGTPTITSDGIASGFSSSNKISKSLTLSGSKIVVKAGFYYKTPSSNGAIIGLMSGSSSIGRCYVSTSGNIIMVVPATSSENLVVSTSDLARTVNDYIVLTMEYNENSTCKFTVLNASTGLSSTKTSTVNWNKTVEEINSVYFGSSGSNLPYEGSIDLKQFSITVDGVQVFSGNKTGTDLIITDNYTVVGTPTITDGVASGFSYPNGDYVTSGSFLQNLGDYDTWSIEIPITFRAVMGNNFDAFLSSRSADLDNTKVAIMLQKNNSQRLRYYLKAQDGTNISYGITSNDSFSGGESLIFKLEYMGTQYIVSTKKSGENWVVQNTINNSKKLMKINRPLFIGVEEGVTTNPWGGSINLYGIRIFGNGHLIYAGKSSITYNLTADGNKIADVQYRPDVYYANYIGYKSSYFTIDTTNQNVTLPYKDIYGLINKSLDYNYTRIQGYDGTATQTLKNVNGVLQWVSDT